MKVVIGFRDIENTEKKKDSNKDINIDFDFIADDKV
jgi:hypothetical protein